jgi:hypothetical protein
MTGLGLVVTHDLQYQSGKFAGDQVAESVIAMG